MLKEDTVTDIFQLPMSRKFHPHRRSPIGYKIAINNRPACEFFVADHKSRRQSSSFSFFRDVSPSPVEVHDAPTMSLRWHSYSFAGFPSFDDDDR